MLENNQYFISSVATSGNNTHNITVPANMAQLKVDVTGMIRRPRCWPAKL